MASSDESGSEFEVQKILKQRKRKGILEYLVQWRGFDHDDSWEPSKNLKHCQKAIDAFEKANEKKSRSRSTSRSRSRSRGRSSSRGRKSPARKKASPKKEVKSETTTVRSRRSLAGGTVEKSEVVTKTIEEVKPKVEDNNQKSLVRERIETVRVQTRTETAPLVRQRRWKFQDYLQFTNSDYPVMIIFICITLITLSFVIEKYVDFGAIWNYIVGLLSASAVYIKGFLPNPNATTK